MNAIERLTEAVRYGDGSGVPAIGFDVLIKDAAAVDALYQAATDVLREAGDNGRVHGNPTSHTLGRSLVALAAAVRRVEA